MRESEREGKSENGKSTPPPPPRLSSVAGAMLARSRVKKSQHSSTITPLSFELRRWPVHPAIKLNDPSVLSFYSPATRSSKLLSLSLIHTFVISFDAAAALASSEIFPEGNFISYSFIYII